MLKHNLLSREGDVQDVTYADDTAVASEDPITAQIYLNFLIKTAAQYGLKPHWGKTVHLRIGHAAEVYNSGGSPIQVVESATYLGNLLDTNANHAAGINKRLGEATQTFSKLADVWSHASISRGRKVAIFNACVVTKLLFGLETVSCSSVSAKRLDAFPAKSLRKILHIQHSFYSRIPNATIYARTHQERLSSKFQRQQLKMFLVWWLRNRTTIR